MSASGQKQTRAVQKGMSALPPNNDRESGPRQIVMSALPAHINQNGRPRPPKLPGSSEPLAPGTQGFLIVDATQAMRRQVGHGGENQKI